MVSRPRKSEDIVVDSDVEDEGRLGKSQEPSFRTSQEKKQYRKPASGHIRWSSRLAGEDLRSADQDQGKEMAGAELDGATTQPSTCEEINAVVPTESEKADLIALAVDSITQKVPTMFSPKSPVISSLQSPTAEFQIPSAQSQPQAQPVAASVPAQPINMVNDINDTTTNGTVTKENDTTNLRIEYFARLHTPSGSLEVALPATSFAGNAEVVKRFVEWKQQEDVGMNLNFEQFKRLFGFATKS